MNVNANIQGGNSSPANRQALEASKYASANGYNLVTLGATKNSIQALMRMSVPEVEYQTDLVVYYSTINAFTVVTREAVRSTIQQLTNIPG